MIERCAGDANASGLGQCLQPRSYVDPIPLDIISVNDDVAEIHADAKPNSLCFRGALIVVSHSALDRGGALDGVYNACELNQRAVAHELGVGRRGGTAQLLRVPEPRRLGRQREILAVDRLDSGDLGRLDSEGNLFIVGRTDDVINRGGQLVYPREIEEVLLGHDAILDAIVVGRPDDVLGAVPVAYVIARASGTGADLIDELGLRCREQLSRYRDALGARLPAGAVLVFLRCWTVLYGAVAMEVFGHLRFALEDPAPMFELTLSDLADMVGLRYPLAP